MKKMVKQSFLALVFALTGCAVASGDIGKTVSEKVQTGFPASSYSVSLLENDPLGRKISKDDFYSIFLSESAKYVNKSLGSATFSWVDENRTAIKVDAQINQGINYDRYTTLFPVKYHYKNGQHSMTLSCPSETLYEWRDFSLTGRLRVDGSKILNVLNQYCTSLSFEVLRYQVVEGEINVDFEDKAVLSNFRRLLKPAGDGYRSFYSSDVTRPTNIDIEKSEKFEFDQKFNNTALSIVIYPYRKGSKVKYAFGVPYGLTSTGTTTYSPELIRNLKKRVEEIARD